jgi:hypothetical protein
MIATSRREIYGRFSEAVDNTPYALDYLELWADDNLLFARPKFDRIPEMGGWIICWNAQDWQWDEWEVGSMTGPPHLREK